MLRSGGGEAEMRDRTDARPPPHRPTMTAPDSNDTPIAGLDDLLAPFHDSEKPRPHWRIGTEAEKFGVLRDNGQPLPYEGERSVLTVFRRLVDQHGWFEEREFEGGEVISLRRGASSITLEPGAQLELSGAPHETIHQTCGEFRGHMAELADISDELGIAWLGIGFHPFAKREDLPWVPKLRYGIMRSYLPTRGSRAIDMMQRTATVQANIDYSSEDDASRKVRLGLRLTPIVTAMFANSPFIEGQVTGTRSHRTMVWTDVDPDRSGLLPFAWEGELTYRRYVEYALDVPMFLIKRHGRLVLNTGQTFRSFLQDGYEGHRATRVDWETHLNSLFPEVRLKKTIELRGADSQDTALTCALPALWKGLVYDERAMAAAERLVEGLTWQQAEASRVEVAEHALRGKLAGRELAAWANDLVEIAAGGLERISNLNSAGKDERIHLDRLKTLVSEGRSPADAILDEIDPKEDFVDQVLDWAHV